MTTIEHEHHFPPNDGDGAAYLPCDVCGQEPTLCAVCEDPTPNTVPIHDDCLDGERKVLDEIDRIVAAWPEPIREILTAVAYDLTGVMSVDDKARLPFALDAVTDDWFHQAAGIKTTPGALELLEEWRTAWVDAGAGGYSADDPHDVVGYLRSRLVWAATNPTRSAFADYRTEVRTVRARLRHINGDGAEPVEGARCLTCGGPLAHARTVGVLDDLAVCQRCEHPHDLVQIGTALVARITTSPDQAPDAVVTEPEARRIFADVGASTIRSWIRREQLTPTGTRHGSATYRVGDIAALARRPRLADVTSADAVANVGEAVQH